MMHRVTFRNRRRGLPSTRIENASSSPVVGLMVWPSASGSRGGRKCDCMGRGCYSTSSTLLVIHKHPSEFFIVYVRSENIHCPFRAVQAKHDT